MSLHNTPTTYGSLSKLFHWVMALLIIGMLGVGIYMTDLPDEPGKFQIYGIHKSLGITLLALALGRLLWRFINTQPAMSLSLSPLLRRFAQGVHGFLYVAMFALPLSGWGMSSAAGYPVSFFGLFTLPALLDKNPALAKILKETHEILGYTLIGVLVVHVVAALVHHFWYKDQVLKRMLP